MTPVFPTPFTSASPTPNETKKGYFQASGLLLLAGSHSPYVFDDKRP
jgi:hypothetical protein